MCSSNPKRRCYNHSCKTFENLLENKIEVQAELKEIETELKSKKFMYGIVKNNESMLKTEKENSLKKISKEIEESESRKETLNNSLKSIAQKTSEAQADIDATKTGLNELTEKLQSEQSKPSNEQNALTIANLSVRLNSGKSRQKEMKAAADRRKQNYKQTQMAMARINEEGQIVKNYTPRNPDEAARKEKKLLELRFNYLEQLVKQRDGFSTFEALVDKNGKVAPLALRESKQGWKYWAKLKDPSDPARSTDLGKVTYSKAKDPTSFYESKGYKLVKVAAPAKAAIVNGKAEIVRADGGYNPHTPLMK